MTGNLFPNENTEVYHLATDRNMEDAMAAHFEKVRPYLPLFTVSIPVSGRVLHLPEHDHGNQGDECQAGADERQRGVVARSEDDTGRRRCEG